MSGTNLLTLLAAVTILAWVCRALNAPVWFTIVGPLVYAGLVVLVVTV